MSASLSELQILQLHLEEHFNPGDPVELLVELRREPTPEERDTMARHMAEHRLPIRLPEVLTGPWPITLRLVFRRPPRGGTIQPLAQLLGHILEPLGWKGVSFKRTLAGEGPITIGTEGA